MNFVLWLAKIVIGLVESVIKLKTFRTDGLSIFIQGHSIKSCSVLPTSISPILILASKRYKILVQLIPAINSNLQKPCRVSLRSMGITTKISQDYFERTQLFYSLTFSDRIDMFSLLINRNSKMIKIFTQF